jgi:hypothetical protein
MTRTAVRARRCASLAVAAVTAMSAPEAMSAPVAGTAAQDARSDCGGMLDAKVRQVIRSTRHQLAYAPRQGPIVQGRPFSLDIVVCPLGSASMPIALRVQADMPAHGHGMNYQPTVRSMGDGRYRADGLMLHMAGRWRLQFELSADGRLERLVQVVDLP